jgi:hypothetical protein
VDKAVRWTGIEEISTAAKSRNGERYKDSKRRSAGSSLLATGSSEKLEFALKEKTM